MATEKISARLQSHIHDAVQKRADKHHGGNYSAALNKMLELFINHFGRKK